MSRPGRPSLSVVVPTYLREAVLLDTVRTLLPLLTPEDELILVDQSPIHESETEATLSAWAERGRLTWVRRSVPSIPAAMNAGLVAARGDVVLFLDDDVVPAPSLLEAHRAAHDDGGDRLVAGRVLQPWDAEGTQPDLVRNPFAATEAGERSDFMGGNFSIGRRRLLRLGGFDENFVRVAYRFERELAERYLAAGGRIEFEPQASLRHLKASSGGTRTYGDHLRTVRPGHTVGEYYYLLRSRTPRRWARFFGRPWRAVLTRHHLHRPWWIPVTLLAEVSGMVWAIALATRGPQMLRTAPAAEGS